jgi:hypothetical protein
MKTTALLLALLTAACAVSTLATAPAPFFRPVKISRVAVGKNVTLELEGARAQKRRVIVGGTICLREGALEHLLTRKHRKEHEAILTADIDARDLHKALLLAGALPGAPARFAPNYKPASGQVVRITLRWQDRGKQQQADARQWVREIATRKAMTQDWVFAGSLLVPDPHRPGEKLYLANDGDVICVANFEVALLDLPVRSSNSNPELLFEARTEKVPPVGTPVEVILEPVSSRK